MAISPQRLTIYLYSAHRAVIFAIAQLNFLFHCSTTDTFGYNVIKPFGTVLFSTGDIVALPTVWSEMTPMCRRLLNKYLLVHFTTLIHLT